MLELTLKSRIFTWWHGINYCLDRKKNHGSTSLSCLVRITQSIVTAGVLPGVCRIILLGLSVGIDARHYMTKVLHKRLYSISAILLNKTSSVSLGELTSVIYNLPEFSHVVNFSNCFGNIALVSMSRDKPEHTHGFRLSCSLHVNVCFCMYLVCVCECFSPWHNLCSELGIQNQISIVWMVVSTCVCVCECRSRCVWECLGLPMSRVCKFWHRVFIRSVIVFVLKWYGWRIDLHGVVFFPQCHWLLCNLLC